jgi:hypothetical protein
MKRKPINIFGTYYKVKVVKELEADGEITFESRTITIKETADYLATLLHEVFHGVVHEGKVGEVLKDDVEEILNEQVVKVLLENFTIKPK